MIDQIILSTNEDPKYMEFWAPVAKAYKKIFPEVAVHLAFLTNREEDDDLVKHFRKFGYVTLFKPVPEVQEFAQAKLIRFILASMQAKDVCYIDDIDLFPLKKSFITSKTDKRPKDHLLCVGGEVYQNNGCYPVSQMTAEGYIWKKFINPWEMRYADLISKDYLSLDIMFDKREDLSIPLDLTQDSYFSDERFLRKLLVYNPVPKCEVERGYDDFMTATLDRYDWKLDQSKLNNHGYENAHGRRPYSKFWEDYAPLMDYLDRTYR